MIDSKSPPAPLDNLPSPLREVAINTAQRLIDAGCPFQRAVEVAAMEARQLQAEAIPSDVDLTATTIEGGGDKNGTSVANRHDEDAAAG